MSWAATAAGVGSLGAGLISGMGKSKQKSGYDVVTLPQYSWTEGNQKSASDYLGGELQRLQSGALPSYYANALPGMQEALQRQLRKRYFGGPMENGLYNNALSAGAVMGINPKAGFAQAQKVSQDYADQSRQIDEYLQQQGVSLQQQSAATIPAMLAGLPQGPASQIVTYGGTSAPGAGGAMSSIGSILGQIPWGSFGGGGGAGKMAGGISPVNYGGTPSYSGGMNGGFNFPVPGSY